MARKNKKTLEEIYHGILARFMSFRDDANYTDQTIFTQEQLVAVIPNDLVRWMKVFAYGTDNPGRDARPMTGRANSISTYKKSISFFMPNKGVVWDEVAMRVTPHGQLKLTD
ncbi:hypothetical protein MHU86_3651 [Fragilaria crotonensis]|nr:hypothetical protein MHU86_3651 [Fragilaria crotonensis]